MKAFRLEILISLCFMLISCMGGGTYGTGIQGYGVTDNSKLTPEYTLAGKLIDENNKELSGFKVSIASHAIPIEQSTDLNGKFEVRIQNSGGTPLQFTVTKAEVSLSCDTYISPAGDDRVELNFIVTKGSKLTCP